MIRRLMKPATFVLMTLVAALTSPTASALVIDDFGVSTPQLSVFNPPESDSHASTGVGRHDDRS